MKKLQKAWFKKKDVVKLARLLLGKVIYTKNQEEVTSGIITETEAYAGTTDKASHAFGGKRTPRTEIMFGEGGQAYVYLCYGIHKLFNVVTHEKDTPHAVLIRGIKPREGLEIMELRRNKKASQKDFTNGPGKVAQALGIDLQDNGEDLTGNRIWISDENISVPANQISIGPRIGVDYAGEDANLPYRFLWHA